MKKHHEVTEIRFANDLLKLRIDGNEYEFTISEISEKLAKASDIERSKYEISPSGYGIHWPLIDEDLSIDGLLGIPHNPKKIKEAVHVKFINNKENILKNEFVSIMENADEVIISSPFLSNSDTLFELLRSDIKLTLICRLSYPASPELFYKILPFLGNQKRIYVYDDNSLHAKIYLFKKSSKPYSCIVGSSNFTDSGFSENKEFNIMIDNNLDEISRYLDYLLNNSFSTLDSETIAYYETFYKRPIIQLRKRKAKISERYVFQYQSMLDRFYYLKATLAELNTIDLPFTYVLDGFCHSFKTRMIKNHAIQELKEINEDKVIKYFKSYLENYWTEEDYDERKSRYDFNQRIRDNLESVDSHDIRKFFLELWSIKTGSGSGRRISKLKRARIDQLKELLSFILKDDLSMPQKYALCLLERRKRGLKIPFLGESAVGEIPGWLIPDRYPIKNKKFLFMLQFFKV